RRERFQRGLVGTPAVPDIGVDQVVDAGTLERLLGRFGEPGEMLDRPGQRRSSQPRPWPFAALLMGLLQLLDPLAGRRDRLGYQGPCSGSPSFSAPTSSPSRNGSKP